MGERLGVTPASPLKHSDSAKFASLQELEAHVGHILPLDEAQAQMDDRAGAPLWMLLCFQLRLPPRHQCWLHGFRLHLCASCRCPLE